MPSSEIIKLKERADAVRQTGDIWRLQTVLEVLKNKIDDEIHTYVIKLQKHHESVAASRGHAPEEAFDFAYEAQLRLESQKGELEAERARVELEMETIHSQQQPDLLFFPFSSTAADNQATTVAPPYLSDENVAFTASGFCKKEYCCSITQHAMVDPVVNECGQTYERAAIEAWYQNHQTDPATNSPVTNKLLIPVFALKSMIDSAREQFRKKSQPIAQLG